MRVGTLWRAVGVGLLGFFLQVSHAFAMDPVRQLRLYALDCGGADFKDMGMFADTGEYDGHAGSIVTPCFLIAHPKGILLWDTGLSNQIAAHPQGTMEHGIHLHVDSLLLDQLRELGLQPKDITYMAFSHFHFDHTGNANLFPETTWIINGKELAWASADPTPFGVEPATFSAYANANTRIIDGDYDVFGDGSVRILKAPGHTPGHQVLKIKFKKTGTLLLSGDLYHTRANRQFKRVPIFNFARSETMASFDRIERIVKNTHARLVVQHDPADFAALPKFPAYLE